MAILDWFTSDAEKYGEQPPPRVDPRYSQRVPHMDANTTGLHMELPRGVDLIRDRPNREAASRWATQFEMADLIMPEQHLPGRLPLLPFGKFGVQTKDGGERHFLVGHNDDKMMVTLASPRAGKTSSVLMPQLYTYPGSMIVFDPKGELARETADFRQFVLGQKVHIVDPFDEVRMGTASYNVLDQIDLNSLRVIDDARSIAQAIIVHDGSSDNSFWQEGGQELFVGLLLTVKQLPRPYQHLGTVRELLTGAHPRLRAQLDKRKFKSERERAEAAEYLLLSEMAKDSSQNPALQRVIQGIGTTYASMPERTRGSMLATARSATQFLDSLAIQRVIQRSSFQMSDLRREPTTIYLVLPAGNEINTHYRWLRLMYEGAAAALKRLGNYPRDRAPIIFLMEEFPVLGNLPLMQEAANFLPGYGVKLHIVAQDLTQIQQHYPHTWQSFLSAAGMVQCFANADSVTLGYIEEWLGNVSFDRAAGQFSQKAEDQRVTMPLLSKAEIRRIFARDYQDQIVMMPGRYPFAMMRLDHDDVEAVKRNMERGQRMCLDGADQIRKARREAEARQRGQSLPAPLPPAIPASPPPPPPPQRTRRSRTT